MGERRSFARWRTRGRLAAGLLVAVAGLLPFATSASAEVNPNFYEELTAVNQKAVVNFLYEQSPQATVPYTEEAAVEESEALSETTKNYPNSRSPSLRTSSAV